MRISQKQYDEIKDDIYYLNMKELTSYFKKYNLPYTIYEATTDKPKRTSIIERKGKLISKLKRFLKGGKVKPTIIPLNVINHDKLVGLTKNSYVFYGQFNSINKDISKLLKRLTDDKFKFGAIAVQLAWDLWISGKLVTYEEYAKLWLAKLERHKKPLKEWAYLTDIGVGVARDIWKIMRIKKANKVLKIINNISIN